MIRVVGFAGDLYLFDISNFAFCCSYSLSAEMKMKLIALSFILLINISINAQRIVSLVPSVTATLQQLNADNVVVGRTSYCPASLSGDNVTVGDVMTVNVEKIVALRPDAVITMGFTKPEVIAKLKSLNIKVVQFHTPVSFEEICSQTIEIGKLAGCYKNAVDVVNDARRSVNSFRQANFDSNKPKAKMFFQIGANPLWAVSPETYLDEMISIVGCQNIVTSGNGSVSRESVVRTRPDIIVITTINKESNICNNEIKEWRKFGFDNFVVVDENVACCPTPLNFISTLSVLVNNYNGIVE